MKSIRAFFEHLVYLRISILQRALMSYLDQIMIIVRRHSDLVSVLLVGSSRRVRMHPRLEIFAGLCCILWHTGALNNNYKQYS